MVLFPPTPIQGDYTKPIVLFIGGVWLLMRAAWCSYMGETDESYPTDSRVLPLYDRRWNELGDIGFDNKRLLSTLFGGFLIAWAAIAFVQRYQAVVTPPADAINTPDAG
jgi:hypothetical protein